MPADWTQPPFVDAPGDLGSALAGAQVDAVENDRGTRTVTLRFALPSDAGTPDATFRVVEATHLLAFVYLPPATSLPEGDALASIFEWAREGLIATLDPDDLPRGLTVARAFLHAGDGHATLTIEGYGEDAEVLVWWEIRASGRKVEAVGSASGP